MANMMKITVSKLKGFRLNAICVVMIIAAVTRTVMTGESIWLTGVCAVALPFICQARRWPQSPEGTSRIVDATSTFLMNVVLMVAYLAILLVVTYAAYTWAPFTLSTSVFSRSSCSWFAVMSFLSALFA